MPKPVPDSRPEVAETIRNGLVALADLARRESGNASALAKVVDLYCDTLEAGGTLFFVGNGGSAADAQHLATEYVVRYRENRRPFAAIALTTDTSLLTATGNDLSFEEIFSRQLEALCTSKDLLVIHSTSGKSPNLVCAVRAARAKGAKIVAFLGRGGGDIAAIVDEAIVVESDSTSHIQELHLAMEHLVCECVESQMLGGGNALGTG
ncbi:MAG: SIS domain-containing protein [Gemmatimonadaceae bacterium]|nr:SIS domain-containing protein [Gemmatimonadaceae bacterium]MBA3657054.1 SIS domain-containing protein [Gemmatimonadaceae bacterium]